MLLTEHTSPEQLTKFAHSLIRSISMVSDHPGTVATILTIAVVEFAMVQEDAKEALAVNVSFLAKALSGLYPNDTAESFTLRRLVGLLDADERP
jgi:hypothetical protein